MNNKKNNLPLVTVITPSFNRANYIEETIESVLNQDYLYLEYLFLDDGSEDDTLEIVDKYKDQIRIISHANMGETATVNKGFKLAKGEYIVVVNSDDPLLPGAISAAVRAFLDNPEAIAVYPDWNEIGPGSETIRNMKLPLYTLENMLKSFNVEMGPATFFKREALDLAGYREKDRKYTGDLEYWFRLALFGKFIHLPQALATHRIHYDAASVTGRGAKMADELASIAENILAHEKAPGAIIKYKRKILGLVYFTATSYCGEDKKSKSDYYKKAFAKQPIATFLRLLRKTISNSHGRSKT